MLAGFYGPRMGVEPRREMACVTRESTRLLVSSVIVVGVEGCILPVTTTDRLCQPEIARDYDFIATLPL